MCTAMSGLPHPPPPPMIAFDDEDRHCNRTENFLILPHQKTFWGFTPPHTAHTPLSPRYCPDQELRRQPPTRKLVCKRVGWFLPTPASQTAGGNRPPEVYGKTENPMGGG